MLRFIPVKKIATSKKLVVAFIIIVAIWIFLVAFMRDPAHATILTVKELETKYRGHIKNNISCDSPGRLFKNDINYEVDIRNCSYGQIEKAIFRNLTGRVQTLNKDVNRMVKQIVTQLVKATSDGVQNPIYPTREIPNVLRNQLTVDFGSHIYFPGGHWMPKTYIPKWKVAIIIPFRDRFQSLNILLRNLVPFLLNQKLEFGIFVAEQGHSEVMNRGLMRNIGYQMARHSGTEWDCYVFHDVDYVPINATNYYGCDGFPKHYATNLEEFKYQNPFILDFGGVVGLTAEQIEKVNGYSNFYWGWGAEDDDIKNRLGSKGYNLTRSNEGFYRHIPHEKAKRTEYCSKRFCLLSYAIRRLGYDGVSSIRYPPETNVTIHSLYTNISVDALRQDWNNKFPNCDNWYSINHERHANNSYPLISYAFRAIIAFTVSMSFLIVGTMVYVCTQERHQEQKSGPTTDDTRLFRSPVHDSKTESHQVPTIDSYSLGCSS